VFEPVFKKKDANRDIYLSIKRINTTAAVAPPKNPGDRTTSPGPFVKLN